MLFGSNILEVGIAVVFVYLLLSLICTALNEGIASLIDKRGKNLVEGIKNLLNDPKFTGLAQQVYNHGLIGGISQYAADPTKRTRLPSYISSESFSLALLDILAARGVIASQHGDLLATAESADDAYEETLEAAAAAPNHPQHAAAVSQAKAAREQARAALETKASDAKAVYDKTLQAANAAPADAALAKIAAEAKHKADGITAALKMLDARRAAIASSKSPKEMKLLLNAGVTLKEALAFARDFAAQNPDPLESIREGLKRLPEGHTKETLLVLVGKTQREVNVIEHQAEAFRKNLEDWFNQAMERVGGWYKRWTQRILLCLSILVVVVSNADTVMLIERLSKDNILRASLIASAQQVAAHMERSAEGASSAIPAPDAKNTVPNLQTVLEAAENVKLPVGWSMDDPNDPGHFPTPELSLSYGRWVFYKLFGLMISVLAVSLGAPFWFDTLSKVVNLRGAGTPPGQLSKTARRPDQ